jgi:hypothetical protein
MSVCILNTIFRRLRAASFSATRLVFLWTGRLHDRFGIERFRTILGTTKANSQLFRYRPRAITIGLPFLPGPRGFDDRV